jgi:hypothetical protein
LGLFKIRESDFVRDRRAPAEHVDHGCRLAAVACADEIVESLID